MRRWGKGSKVSPRSLGKIMYQLINLNFEVLRKDLQKCFAWIPSNKTSSAPGRKIHYTQLKAYIPLLW